MRTLKDQLIEKGLSQLEDKREESREPKTRGKQEEQFTSREWAEIMGVNRDTFKRVSGAIRRR